MVQHNSIDHAGLLSVSYASNSTNVSTTSAAGASSLVSRADHVHVGAALGAWTDYTPTVTNLTLGDGTLVGRKKLLDANTYVWRMSLTWGSTTSCSGDIAVALPATASATGKQTCAGFALDSGTTYFGVAGRIPASGTTVTQVIADSGSAPSLVNATVPMTWATGDELVLFGTLEI